MIVVSVELVPGGNWARAREIATMEIANVSDLANVSDYMVRIQQEGAANLGVSASEETLEIKDHPRNQSIWRLIEKAIQHAKRI